MRRALARVLVVAALACFALLLAGAIAGATELQGQNSATGAGAASGPSIGGNTAAFAQGPTAASVISSGAQQLGSNRGKVAQRAKGTSGDAVAAGQVTGATGSASVMNSNAALGAVSAAGTVITVNTLAAQVGPLGISLIGVADVTQTGDNALDASQEVSADTGDAVVGGQVTGIAGAEHGSVSNMNAAALLLGLTLPATSANVSAPFVAVGPTAIGGALGPASASQVGRNDEVLSQSAGATTGDVVAGSQITGMQGAGRPFEAQHSNAALGVVGIAGPPTSANTLTAFAGPTALSDILARAQQSGDNVAEATQTVDATSGEAVVGSQVTGLVGQERARLAIQNQQASDFDFALSDVALSTNTLTTLDAGPFAGGANVAEALVAQASQMGDNAVKFEQTSSAASSSTVSGSQITGAVAGARSDVDVVLSNVAPWSIAGGLSGGAISSSQVTGVTAGDGSDINVSAQNNATLPGISSAVANFSGAANIATSNAGPAAIGTFDASASQFGDDSIDATQVTNDGNTATLVAGPFASAGVVTAPLLANARASQFGDDKVALSQEAASASGDSIAGSQVTGAVNGNGGTTDIQVSNQAIFALGISGAIPVPNVATVTVGATARSASAFLLDTASAQQTGDSSADIGQTVEATTGDALGGAQVVGVVGGSERSVQPQNSALLVLGLSGNTLATNTLGGVIGPSAGTASGLLANVSANGDTITDIVQDFLSETGDAISGGQIVGGA